MKTLILIAFIFFCGQIQGSEMPLSCKEAIISFFAQLKSGDQEKAINELLKEKIGKWGAKDSVIKMVSVLKNFQKESVGDFYGYDIIHQASIGKNYISIVVMAKYERQPVFFRFKFYRPEKTFISDGLNMNTDESEVIKEWLSRNNELQDAPNIP